MKHCMVSNRTQRSPNNAASDALLHALVNIRRGQSWHIATSQPLFAWHRIALLKPSMAHIGY